MSVPRGIKNHSCEMSLITTPTAFQHNHTSLDCTVSYCQGSEVIVHFIVKVFKEEHFSFKSEHAVCMWDEKAYKRLTSCVIVKLSTF